MASRGQQEHFVIEQFIGDQFGKASGVGARMLLVQAGDHLVNVRLPLAIGYRGDGVNDCQISH
jgi:hypothetical protein